MGRSRGWPVLLEAMARLPAADRLRLIGRFTDGSEPDFAGPRRGPRPRPPGSSGWPGCRTPRRMARLAEADIALVLFQPGEENHRLALPHKLFDAMQAGLPVIAPAFAAEVAGIIRAAGCGVLVDSADPAAIAAAVERLRDPARRAALGAAGRQAAASRYGWAREAARLVALYRGLAPLPPVLGERRGRWRRGAVRPIATAWPAARRIASCSTSRWIPSIACLALPAAMLLDAPGAWPDEAWWLVALPGAVLALLAAGLPVRLPQQYWRYAGLPDLLGIVGAARRRGGAVLGRAACAGRLACRPTRPSRRSMRSPSACCWARRASPAGCTMPGAVGRDRSPRSRCCWSAPATAPTCSSAPSRPGTQPAFRVDRHPVDAVAPGRAAHPGPPDPRHRGRDRRRCWTR